MDWVEHLEQRSLYRSFYVEHARAKPALSGRCALRGSERFSCCIALAAIPGDPDLQENLHQAERYLKAQRNGAQSK